MRIMNRGGTLEAFGSCVRLEWNEIYDHILYSMFALYKYNKTEDIIELKVGYFDFIKGWS